LPLAQAVAMAAASAPATIQPVALIL